MKVKMLVSRCGPTVNDAPGDIIEVSKDEAERMMASDPPQCEVVRSSKAERATKKQRPEKAVK